MTQSAQLRYRVDPGDVPPEKAARRLHLTLERFHELFPSLKKRGFPDPDPTTGNYDIDAIDAWRRGRHPHIFKDDRLTPVSTARDPKEVLRARLTRGGNG